MLRTLVMMGSLWVAILFHCSQVGFFVYGAFDLAFEMQPGDLFFVYLGSAGAIYVNWKEGFDTLKDVHLASDRGANAISLRTQAFKAFLYLCFLASFTYAPMQPLEFFTDYHMLSSYGSSMFFVRLVRAREKEERAKGT